LFFPLISLSLFSSLLPPKKDYTNPFALDWWHKKMDLVLKAGVDGFKCDGTDPYIIEYPNGAYVILSL
jgi:alpha-glucosidase (family GH31 glycosyl hydrolase)